MLKNFTVAMLPILALGADIVYENAIKVDKSRLPKYETSFQTHNRAAEPDSELWIAEDEKKLDVEFKVDDAYQALLKSLNVFNEKKDEDPWQIVVNWSAIEMGFAMTTADDDVIDAYRYRRWQKTGEELTIKMQRRTFKKSEGEDGEFKFDSDNFEDWTEEVPDGAFKLSGDCQVQKENEAITGLFECNQLTLKVRRNFVEDTDAWRKTTLVNNNYETMSEDYWGWMRSISQDVVDDADWKGEEDAAWEEAASDLTSVDYPTLEDGGITVETINKAFATTEAMRKAGQEGIDQFEKGFDGWYGPLYDMAKSIADDFKTWNVWWNNQDADVQSGMSDDMKEQWEEELQEWDLSLQMLGSIKQYYLAHISVLGSEMENAKTADEVEAVMAKIDKEKDFVTGQVFKEMRSLATQIEEKTAGALTLLTTFQRMIDEGYSFKKKPEIDEE